MLIDPTGAVPDLAYIDGPDGGSYVSACDQLNEMAPNTFEALMTDKSVISMDMLTENINTISMAQFMERMLPFPDGNAGLVNDLAGRIGIFAWLGGPISKFAVSGVENTAAAMSLYFQYKDNGKIPWSGIWLEGSSKVLEFILGANAKQTLGSAGEELIGNGVSEAYEYMGGKAIGPSGSNGPTRW